MLEYNGFREGPILEMNEEYVMGTLTKTDFLGADWRLSTSLPIEIGRVTNTRWAQFSNKKKTKRFLFGSLRGF